MLTFIQKIRSYRPWGIAIFDVFASFIGLTILFLISWKYHFPKLHWWMFVIAAAYVLFSVITTANILFGINTEANYKFGLSYKPSS
jgi:hypothetical protein